MRTNKLTGSLLLLTLGGAMLLGSGIAVAARAPVEHEHSPPAKAAPKKAVPAKAKAAPKKTTTAKPAAKKTTPAKPKPKARPAAKPAPAAPVAGEHKHHMKMTGAFGNYAMTREGSGTAWVPEAAPMAAIHSMSGGWMVMKHGFITASYTHQGGPRGDNDTFASSMGMIMGQRDWRGGTLGLRAMGSLDPILTGKDGYPLLFQTGETADGETHLVDRQHPHDLIAELSASYSRPIDDKRSWFVYAGLPGEPALGPPVFMHRYSGMLNPEAPLSHHWLDSSHITFGVITLGYVWDEFKLDASVFNGREPDEDRYDIETGALDSESVRLSWNPTTEWSLQVSRGWLKSPEQLEPDVDVERTTVSAIYHLEFVGGRRFETAMAYGENKPSLGEPSEAWLVDAALQLSPAHNLFGRAERVEEQELFDDSSPLHGQTFTVNKLSLGYVYSVPVGEHYAAGFGVMGSQHFISDELETEYGKHPASYMLFVRLGTR